MHDLRPFLQYCLLFGIIIGYVYSQDFATNQIVANACVGRTLNFKCDPTADTSYTVVIDESFLGIINPQTVVCAYNPGDCRENVKINCAPGVSTCNYIGSTLATLSGCSSKKAEYLHVRWKCVPWTSRTIQTYSICDGGDITTSNGFIQSPDYPKYSTVSNDCTRKIVAPPNKVIKIRVLDMQIKNPESNNKCVTDYLKVIDTTDTYTSCGNDKANYEQTLCSSSVYVSYKAPNNVLFAKGFKLYYEFADRSTQPDCPTGTPGVPMTTTPIITTPSIPLIVDQAASQVSAVQVCRGGATSLVPYVNYVLFIIDSLYGVPQSLTCEPYSSLHCNAPAVINCPFNGECLIRLGSDVPVGDCGNQFANYLRFTYRFLPTVSSRNFSICDGSSDIDGTQNKYGIITSRNYPNWEPNQNCGKRIVAPAGTVIRVYFTDISIDPKDSQTLDCTTSYVSVEENNRIVKFCGTRTNGEVFWYASCTNALKISYKSSNQNSFYRGFNMYYEVVDGFGVACPDASTTQTTTTTTTTVSRTTQAATSSITSQIMTEGGNAFGKPCVFPFKYNGQQYDTCINVGQADYWCATTSDYDKDQERGNCKLGLTSVVGFDLCPNNVEKFSCPKGYLTYILTAEYGVTSDGSCDYSKKTCSTDGLSAAKTTAGVQSASIAHLQKTIAECSNKRSNFLHIEYSCVPDTAPGYDVFTVGATQSVSSVRGIIQTQGYPSYQTNINGQIKIIVNAANKQVNIYNVNTAIQLPAIGQVCQNDKITITDSLQDPLVKCGSEKPDLFYQSCSTSININVVTGGSGSFLYKGSKLFYEIVDRAPDAVCPTTTIPTTPGTGTTSTTTQFKPQYVIDGLSSPTDVKSICKNSLLDILNPTIIRCPSSYIIAVRRSFFGISKTNECFYRNGDCISFKDNPSINNCIGKEVCSFTHLGTNLPECNNAQSTYLQVEYDCIPTALPANSMCTTVPFTDKRGILKNPSYPGYDNIQGCTAKITTTANQNILKAYIIDMQLDQNCDRDSVVMFDSFNLTTAKFCGQQVSILAIETCTSELTISLNAQSNADPALRGILIYYEAIPRPQDFICPAFTQPAPTTSTSTTRTTTTPTTPSSTRPENYGLALPIEELVTCSSTRTISCPTDYNIVILSSEYATNDLTSIGCAYSPLDCFETTTAFNQGCSGKQSCPITYFSRQITACNKRTSKYLYITYQCVPINNAGKPNPNPNLDICTNGGPDNKITVDSSVIIRSPNYPNYPSQDTRCTKKVVTTPGKALKVYLTNGGFKSAANCNGSRDYVSVSDCAQAAPVQCGSLLTAKLLMESVSNEITVDFSVTGSSPSSLLKGFQMYIEAVPSNTTCSSVTEPQGSTTTPPNAYLGFISPVYHNDICVLTEKTLQCPENYYVLVQDEEFISTDSGCKHSATECKQPTDLAYQKCSSQSKCTIFVPNTPLNSCQNKFADILDVEHLCLPANYPTIKTYTCGTDRVVDARNGYIVSPGYPAYSTGVNCELNVTEIDGYGFKIFIVDLVLSDYDDLGNCTDSIQVNYDPVICSSNQPKLVHQSERRGVHVKYQSLLQGANIEGLRGFKLYFEAYSVRDTTLPTPTSSQPRVNRTTRLIQRTTIVNSHHSGSLTGWSLGLGIPAVLAVSFYALWLLKRGTNSASGYTNFSSSEATSSSSSSSSSSNVNTTRVNFSKKKNNDLDDMKSFENPNFSIENTAASIE